MNAVLLSKEWFWAAEALLAGFLAGPDYWLPGIGIGVTFLLAGVLGRRNARHQALGMTLDLELDEAVLSRSRLSILVALLPGDAVDFTWLQKNLNISDGNLGTHLRRLEAENYVKSAAL
jgi:predicted transcriptional regulator